MRGRPALAAAIALLGACQGTALSNPGAPAPTSGLSILIQATTSADLPIGGFASLKISIQNASDLAVLVRSITARYDVSEGAQELGHPVYGALHYDTALGVYTYDAMAQQATSEQFQEGLLLPGQSLVVDRTIRLLGPREEIIVAYGELTELDVRRELYFAARDSGIRTKYRRPDDAALREFAALGPRTPNVGTGPGRESVLATQPLMTRPGKTATQAVDFAGAKSPPLVWAEAEKRGRGRFLTYCVTFGGWVFAGDGGDVVVGATGDRSLPSAPARLYRDLDLDHKFTLRVDEKSARELGVKAQPGDGMYRQGLFAEVTAAESPRVLEAARAAGRRIELQRYFFDRYFYSLR